MIDNRLAPYGAFALRTSLGLMFIAHAYLKLAVFTVPGFEGFLGKVLVTKICCAKVAKKQRESLQRGDDP